MVVNEIDLLTVRARILSKASFFTGDQRVLRDLMTVIESLEQNMSKDFYRSEGMSLEEIEQFYFQYIRVGLLAHIQEQWEGFPKWQQIIFSFGYRRVFRRMCKVRFLMGVIVGVEP
ncbi:hypothetical protein Bb109J_c2487 [Bdellovibrio bacteriovorus]|uniref:hypothetical protein n=1 Tax=Bdellovibrio bacteriovorus TaxID=959 RepID=UPI00045C063B|nr:hypothetical protein [Bdellovibrio bacteriovorus]AHZ85176.1 hypothetical protein EP01_09530 [Bdellovibrio bacteriovorus]BEV69067.1 hypothetical protein Bb109J_c2487 [Bdellovibrio bacteriovorus]